MVYFSNAEHFKSLCGYEIDGAWYPRVTKIVDIKAKPALYKFYADAGSFKTGENIKAQSATEGTLIHNTIEGLLTDKNPDIPEKIKPAVTAFLEFVDSNKIAIHPELVEQRVMHPKFRYAGTLDALAEIGGKFGVLDIKTSYSIFRDYNLQTSAYVAALHAKPLVFNSGALVPQVQTRWILRIDQNKICRVCGATLREKGGGFKIRKNYEKGASRQCEESEHQWGDLHGEIELKEFPYWQEDFAAFLGAKKLWEWENDYWLRQIEYL